MTKNPKIIFFGTPDFAMPVLEALTKNGYNVSHFQPKSLRDDKIFKEFKNLKPNICIVAAYGKIIPSKYLEIPKYGFLNIHPSLLPKYRGPSPIQTAIFNGDKETGVSIMLVDEKIDHGPILASEKLKIQNEKYYKELEKKLSELGAKLLIKTLPKYISGEIKPREQDHVQATFTKLLTREDGRLNWNQSNEQIYNQIRALNPEPGTWTTWKGKVINISNLTTPGVVNQQVINIIDSMSKKPGAVIKINDDIAIGTGTGYLFIKSIQLEGRKEMNIKSFINGHPNFLNSILSVSPSYNS